MVRRSSIFLLMAVGCGPVVNGADPGSSSSSSSSTDTPPSASTATTDPATDPATDPTVGSGPGSTTAVDPTGFDGTTTTTTGVDGTSTGPDLEPVAGECDIWAQDCPAGEKCNAYASDGGTAWNAVACFPVVRDPAAPGEPCEVVDSGTSGFDTCALGAMCWNVDDDLQGECTALCTGSSDDPSCADPERACSIANGGALAICLQTCEPDVDSCPEGEQCFPIDGAWVCAPDADGGVETCDASECSAGTFCVVAEAYGPECEATACCADFCELDAPSCALPQHTCVPLYEKDPPKGFENVGVCVIP